MPYVNAIYQSFRSDKRFVMIGLNVDDTPRPALQFVQKNNLSWLQGYVGPWMPDTPIMKQYGVGLYDPDPNYYCLVGPDGRIIALGGYIEAVKPAIQNILSDK